MDTGVGVWRTYETTVSVDEIVGLELDEWIDYLLELVGAPLLMDVEYRAERVDSHGNIVFTVEGDASMQIESDARNEEA